MQAKRAWWEGEAARGWGPGWSGGGGTGLGRGLVVVGGRAACPGVSCLLLHSWH